MTTQKYKEIKCTNYHETKAITLMNLKELKREKNMQELVRTSALHLETVAFSTPN